MAAERSLMLKITEVLRLEAAGYNNRSIARSVGVSHLLGADLDLVAPPAGSEDRGVQRAVHVGLGRGKVLGAAHDLGGDPGIGLEELEGQVLQLPTDGGGASSAMDSSIFR
ncbi:MAG: hypothetical protein Q8N53_08415 [Longimicrobiales bacterium]|nr:hypothetical protein [Longimicrobiales bacterium]